MARQFERNTEMWVVREVARRWGVKGIKMNTTSETGWPDRQFFIPGGKPFFVEFKSPGEQLSGRQKLIEARLLHDGYDVEVHEERYAALRAIERRIVEATRVSKESHKMVVGKEQRSSLAGSRIGEDEHNVGSDIDAEKDGKKTTRANSRSIARLLQRVASRG